MVIYLSLLVALAGVLLYALSANPKMVEIGKIMFWTGLLAFLLRMTGPSIGKGIAHTNSIESVWALLKRGVYGVFHHISSKHVGRYADEFAFRLNAGKVSRHTIERLDSFVETIKGKRLTYAGLIA